ncbi:MAG: flagellar motor protein MotB [Candidatus Scalindua sp.]|nr:flagellar motor protein MotB [Candidatus Scalindua sp.]
MDEEPKKDPNEWALAYGDMITLLMTFFVLIIAMSSPKSDDEAEMMKKSSGTGENLMVATLKESGIFNDKIRSKSRTLIDENDLLPPISDMELIKEDLVVFLTENELFEVIDLLTTEEGFTIRIKADILFDTGDISLKADYLYLLDKIAELLAVISNNVRIEGHTDDRYRDDNRTGNTLSITRASRVCDYIIAEEMLSSSRFGVAGHGRFRPLLPNTNDHNRALNRRVEVIIKEKPRDV